MLPWFSCCYLAVPVKGDGTKLQAMLLQPLKRECSTLAPQFLRGHISSEKTTPLRPNCSIQLVIGPNNRIVTTPTQFKKSSMRKDKCPGTPVRHAQRFLCVSRCRHEEEVDPGWQRGKEQSGESGAYSDGDLALYLKLGEHWGGEQIMNTTI